MYFFFPSITEPRPPWVAVSYLKNDVIANRGVKWCGNLLDIPDSEKY